MSVLSAKYSSTILSLSSSSSIACVEIKAELEDRKSLFFPRHVSTFCLSSLFVLSLVFIYNLLHVIRRAGRVDAWVAEEVRWPRFSDSLTDWCQHALIPGTSFHQFCPVAVSSSSFFIYFFFYLFTTTLSKPRSRQVLYLATTGVD